MLIQSLVSLRGPAKVDANLVNAAKLLVDRKPIIKAALLAAAVAAASMPSTLQAIPVDMNFMSGAAGTVGSASFQPRDGTTGATDFAGGTIAVTPSSRTFSASGSTSTGPIRGTNSITMNIEASSPGSAQQLVLEVEGDARFTHDNPAAGGGGGIIDLATISAVSSGMPIVVQITGDGPIAYSILDASTPFYAPNFRDAETDTLLPPSGTLLPGLYEIDFLKTASAEYDLQTGALVRSRFGSTDWQLVLNVPEPTTSAAIAAVASPLLRRRRR